VAGIRERAGTDGLRWMGTRTERRAFSSHGSILPTILTTDDLDDRRS